MHIKMKSGVNIGYKRCSRREQSGRGMFFSPFMKNNNEVNPGNSVNTIQSE